LGPWRTLKVRARSRCRVIVLEGTLDAECSMRPIRIVSQQSGAKGAVMPSPRNWFTVRVPVHLILMISGQRHQRVYVSGSSRAESR
jgi:hypothetical protein